MAADDVTMAVRTQALTKRYGAITAVSRLELAVKQGELFGLLGPNGAGKTTLFSMLSCQLKPTSGDAFVDGHSIVREARRVKAGIGIVPQVAAAYDKLTGRENLELFARLYGLSKHAAESRSSRLLDRVGLRRRGDDPVGTYSGGMRHRLNIVLGLIHEPRIVFFDEPTTGLDPIARQGLWDVIRGLRDEGRTVILTTHYMQEAEDLCDRVAILDRGRIVAMGDPNRMGKSLEATFLQCTTSDRPDAELGAVS